MKTLIAVCRDGARHFVRVVPADFNTQAWADSRAAAFKLLGVVAIEEEQRGVQS